MSFHAGTKPNTVFLILLAYLLTGVTGLANILPMVVKTATAHYFDTSLVTIGYVFSFYMVGMLVGCFVNGYVLKVLSVKRDIGLAVILYLISVLALYWVHSLLLVGVCLVILGLVAGVTLTVPYSLIIHAFSGKQRSSTLNRVDLMYSVGGFIAPQMAYWMLRNHASWQSVFAAVLVVFAVIATITLITQLPNLNKPGVSSSADKNSAHQPHTFSKWNLNVYLIGLAMFCYVASYMGLNFWVVHYAVKVLHISRGAASWGISAFWWFYAIGCLFSSFMVRIMPVYRYMLGSAIVALVSFFLILHAQNGTFLIISISLLGLGCATLYSSSLSYGSHQVMYPSPRIVSYLVAFATVGTTAAEFISSYIVRHLGLTAVIQASAALFCVYIVIFSVTLFRKGTQYLKHH